MVWPEAMYLDVLYAGPLSITMRLYCKFEEKKTLLSENLIPSHTYYWKSVGSLY